MEFRWEPLTAEDQRRILRDWQRGKGLLGGNPRLRPSDSIAPAWAEGQPFIRALMLDAPETPAAVRFLEQRDAAPSIELEIGPARADFILNRARHHPNTLFLGVEVLTAAVRRALARRARQELDNIWFCDDDVRFALPRLCTRHSLTAVHLLFPDPWWKRRHEHRRLMTPPFLSQLAEHMAPGGLLHVRSDVPEFMAWTEWLVEQSPDFQPPDMTLACRVEPYQPTHRELWCRSHGFPISVLCSLRA